MSSNADFVSIEPSYLNAVLASLWRRRILVVAIVAVALALGMIAIQLMPHRYTAEAYIRGEFFAAPGTVAKENDSIVAGSMSLDLVRVIETQSQLLQSHLLARRVVQQLGLERLRSLVSSATKAPADEIDIAATRLLLGLSVTSDPRSYLIIVRFTAEDPELAERVTNAFVVELLRSARLQTLFKQRSLAQDTLSIRLAKFGDKHPSVVRAKMQLAATDQLLKKELNQGQEVILQAAGENVTKAIHFPLSRKAWIVFFLLSGLAIGVGVALWLERDRWLIYSGHLA